MMPINVTVTFGTHMQTTLRDEAQRALDGLPLPGQYHEYVFGRWDGERFVEIERRTTADVPEGKTMLGALMPKSHYREGSG